MAVLSGGLFLFEVETSPGVWAECGDMTRVTKANNATVTRTRVFRKTYRLSSIDERVYTLVGLLNYTDAGQSALLTAERTNTPIRVRWAENSASTKKMVTARVASVAHEATPEPGAFQGITYELRSTGALLPG